MNPVEFRRTLHRNPELSFREEQTAAFISEQLTLLGIPHRPIAGTGVLAWIEGHRKNTHQSLQINTTNSEAYRGPAMVLRADIDALPIHERTGLEYASQNEGVMHACGHDMHVAVLFGVLQQLAAEPDFCGTLFGLFQPGEECNPGGASKVLAERPFDAYQIRAVLGEHVEPGMAVGTVGFRAGKYMAANDELRFKVRGVGGHGAMRALLKDPVVAAAELITRLTQLNDEECVLSLGRVIADGATNIIPDVVSLEGTLRTFDEQRREIIHSRLRNIASDIDNRLGVSIEVDINHGYPCVVNNEVLVQQAVILAKECGLEVEMLPLRTTAEDFGFYCKQYPSLFYRLGVGTDTGRLHTATFAPDERAIATGIEFMKRFALQILEK